MMSKVNRIVAATALMLASSTSFAAIVGVTGSGLVKTAGTDITSTANNANIDPNNQWGFNERQGVLLGSALAVNGGTIAAGTRVDSHMIFFDSGGPSVTTDATWTFSGNILGVMSDTAGNLERNSTGLLGSPLVSYPCDSSTACFANRGLEIGSDTYNAIGNTLRLHSVVSSPGDWIRVVTVSAVPEPSTVALFALGMGFLGFVGLRRGRR